MNRFAFIVTIAMLLSPWGALGDAGTNAWTYTTDGTGSDCGIIKNDSMCFLNVPASSTVSSKTIRIRTDSARVCVSSSASGTYVLHVVVTDSTDNGSFVPTVDPASTLSSASGDCAEVFRGDRIYMTVSVAPTGSADVLSILGTD